MKIVIPTADYPPIEGGISSVAVHVSRELAALGHEVTVVAPHFPGQAAFDAAEPVRVIRYRGYAFGWLRLAPLACAAWNPARRADLVLGINVAYGGALGLVWRKMWKRPYVVFAYAYEFLKFPPQSPLGHVLHRIYEQASAVIAISRFTRDNLVNYGVDPAHVHVIHPGAKEVYPQTDDRLAALRKRYALEDRQVILAVGRLIPRKGHLTLIEAMPHVLEKAPGAHLVVVGRGPMLSDCSRKAQQLGVRERVTFTGRLDEEALAGLYQLCDVFALPTGSGAGGQVEGFGLVFTEAHAYAKPVVAGRSGGVVDAVLDGETGLLVEPDDPEALAHALVRVLTDEALARRLGENGKRRVGAELNWPVFTRALLGVVEKKP